MSIVLSMYSMSAFREVVLMDRGNPKMQIMIEKKLFGLRRDVLLHLEKDEKRGWWLRPGDYRVSSNVNHRPLPEGAFIRDGISLDIEVSGSHFTMLAYEQTNPFNVYRKYPLGANGVITVGSLENNVICYALDNLVTRYPHCKIELRNGSAYIIDCSTNGTYVNSQRIEKNAPVPLRFGDSIRIFRLNIVYLGSMLAVHAREGFEVRRTRLSAEQIERMSTAPGKKKKAAIAEFHRAPRIMPVLHTEQVEIDAPPNKHEVPKMPLFMRIGPSFTMALPMLITAFMSIVLANTSGTARSAFMYTGIVMALTSAGVGVFWAIKNMRYQERMNAESEANRERRYKNYLADIWRDLEVKYADNQRNLNDFYSDAESCCDLNEDSGILWNRNATHPDFMSYRIGMGTVDFQEEIIIPKERLMMIDDELADQPRQIREHFKKLTNVPVLLDVRKEHLIGVVGKKSRSEAVDVVRTLITQIVTANCYTDVKLALIYDGMSDIDRDAWNFMYWFPHVWSEDRKIRYIATNPDETGDVFYALAQIFRNRMEEDGAGNSGIAKPQYIMIVTDPRLIEGSIIANFVFERKVDLGLSTIFLADMMKSLPNECECIVNCAYNSITYTHDRFEDGQKVKFDEVAPERVARLAKTLGNIRVTESGEDGEIPNMLSFFDMYGVTAPEALNASERWNLSDPTSSMKALVGFKGGNRPCYLDLHEKYHGPHGLVAGTTGSGKSETLQTYILSLAVNYSPEDVGFFIIDYKGGGMANLFEGLPHMVGAISNLSGNQVNRAMISINSEIHRRQRIFAEYGVNRIDAYTSLYKAGEADEPMQHLLIIIDEFAELKREQPEFMKELISVAQVGRSLGVHLILATQRPSGTVDGNIWANSRFKLCLRVQNKEDSMEMLHRPDAAFLTQTGRCYMQVGNDEIFELFQSGWSGASFDRELGGRSILIAQMLSASGKVDLAGSHTKLRLKEEQKVKWIGQLLGILGQTQNALSENVCAPGFDFMSQTEFADFFYEKVRAIQPDYERNQFNNMRISDLISVYRTLVLRGTYTGDPKLVISEAAAQRKRLPEQKAMTQLQSVVEYLAAEAVESGIREVRKLWLPVLSGRLYLSELQSFTGRCFDGRHWPGAPKRFRLGATVGFGDDPENQAQMDVGIDFASGGHHMVCGTVSTGKSTFLQTAVFSLCSHYSPEQLNVYALDFSSQMLTVFEDSVHVGGVLTDADTENDRIAKFFTLIGKIISERKRLFKGTNFTDYVNHNGWTIPAILIVIDNYGSFHEKTGEAYEAVMSQLVKEGVGYGIFLLVSAGGIGAKEIPTRMAENFRTGICLEMQDAYAYGEILHVLRPEVLPEANIKGRGLIGYGNKIIEFQTALAAESAEGPLRNDMIREKIGRMNAAWKSLPARRIPTIPDKPVREEFVKLPDYGKMLADPRRLPAAYNEEDAEICGPDLFEHYIFFVTGTRGSGKSVYMKNLILAAAERKETNLIFENRDNTFEAISKDLGIRRAADGETTYELLKYVFEEMRKRIPLKKKCLDDRLSEEETFKATLASQRINLFIGDLGSFIREVFDPASPAANGKPVVELIATKGRFYNVYLYAEIKDADQMTLMSNPVVREMCDVCAGVRFGGRLNDSKQKMFEFANVSFRDVGKSLKPGIGIIPSEDKQAKIEKIVVPMYRG